MVVIVFFSCDSVNWDVVLRVNVLWVSFKDFCWDFNVLFVSVNSFLFVV